MQDEEIPIRELLSLCLSRPEDQKIWQGFVRRIQPLIANVIINTLRRWREPSPSLVDDLIQETYLKLFANDMKALRSIRNEHENAIFGYLKVTASRVTVDYFRKPEHKVAEVELTDVVASPSPFGFDKIEFERRKDKIQELLERLSGTETYQRDVMIFWFYFEQGYTANDISQIPNLGLTVKGVESTLLRLVRYVKDGLAGSGHAAEAPGS